MYIYIYIVLYISIYIYIYHLSRLSSIHLTVDPDSPKVFEGTCGHIRVRSVFKISCLFLRPRPWQFEN